MNAEKHAQASEVKVTLCFDSDRFSCTVRDNGVGFDPVARPVQEASTHGFGLDSMTQRAQSVGGTVDISSAPGAGTMVTFAAPLPQEVS